MFDALSPQRRRLVLGAASATLLVIMAAAVIAVIRVIGDSAQPVSQTAPGPVLLVPGYGETSSRLSRWPRGCVPLAGRL